MDRCADDIDSDSTLAAFCIPGCRHTHHFTGIPVKREMGCLVKTIPFGIYSTKILFFIALICSSNDTTAAMIENGNKIIMYRRIYLLKI